MGRWRRHLLDRGPPAEGGRSVLVRAAADGTTTDLTPPPFDVRTRVHEYGGGAASVAGGTVVFSNRGDDRLYRLDPGVERPADHPGGAWRYADLRFDPARRRFWPSARTTRARASRSAAIVAVAARRRRGAERVLVEGPTSSPRRAVAGRDPLAWLEWDHPDMPWDATRLRVAPIREDGSIERVDLAAGGPTESVVQPEWAPDGTLHLDQRPERLVEPVPPGRGPRLEPLAPMDAEFADPAWVFDRSSYAFLPDGSIVAPLARWPRPPDPRRTRCPRRRGRDPVHRARRHPRRRIDVVAVAGSPTEAPVVVALDPVTWSRPASCAGLDDDDRPRGIAVPESIAFPTTGGRTAHALFYPPTNPDVTAPDEERPPLLVLSHGGPTAQRVDRARPRHPVPHQPRHRRRRRRLRRDAPATAAPTASARRPVGRRRRRRLHRRRPLLVARGDVDPDRLAIEGGSAGGYTTLAALAFRDTFAAGISLFGIGDLEALARDTHKFESRYLDRLVGPYPAMADRYRRALAGPLPRRGLVPGPRPPGPRRPGRAAVARPKRSSPPSLANGIPHAYLAFEGEGHGFRGAAIRRTIEARLAFLGAVFGFTPADDRAARLPGIEAWRAPARRASAVAG